MKIAANIVGALLGLLFIASGIMVLFNLVQMLPPKEGTATAHFMAAFVPTGYLTFVKVLELLGGILVAIPKTRNLGLLVLGPIVVNIIAFSVFVAGEGAVYAGSVIFVSVASAFLLFVERNAFAKLVTR